MHPLSTHIQTHILKTKTYKRSICALFKNKIFSSSSTWSRNNTSYLFKIITSQVSSSQRYWYTNKVLLIKPPTFTQAHQSTQIMPMDILRVLNLSLSKGLVNKSASWFLVGICSRVTIECSTRSLMKWYLISMCFVCECWTGFLEMLMALKLSQ